MAEPHELERALGALDGVLALRLEERDVANVHSADGGRRVAALARRSTPFAGDDPLPDATTYLGGGPMGSLAEGLGLDDASCLVLVAAVAPHVDERYAALLASLSDRVGDAITGEALRNLCGRTANGRARGVAALAARGPLRRLGVIQLDDSDDGMLAGTVRVPPDVLQALLGLPRQLPQFSDDFPATPLTTVHDLSDVIVPAPVRRRINDVLDRVRHRDCVLDSWGFAAHHDNVSGITVMFHGPSGTGKTMTAAALAKAADRPAYRVDLSALVSKYIGETAKNLERVFRHAERERCLLFFDEADSIFGKRGEVTDARDRYANQEVSYLLQRIEGFDGVVVLATNLLANIDESFLRRIDIQIEFPAPDFRHRLELWQRVFPTAAPLVDVDFDALARTYELTGAQIRDAAVEAAFRAAANGQVVTTGHLDDAVALQFRKTGLMVPG